MQNNFIFIINNISLFFYMSDYVIKLDNNVNIYIKYFLKFVSMMKLDMYSNEYHAKILSAAYQKPRSVEELSILFDIPVEVCHMKVSLLKNAGLLKVVAKIQKKSGEIIDFYKYQESASCAFMFSID